MDSTSPAPASIVGSTNAAAVTVFAFVAFAFGLVERRSLPPKTLRWGHDGYTATDGDRSSTEYESSPG